MRRFIPALVASAAIHFGTADSFQYHAGELAVQTAVGVHSFPAALEGMVQPRIEAERDFRLLRSLNMLVAGIENAKDAATPLAVELLFGHAGFVDPDTTTGEHVAINQKLVVAPRSSSCAGSDPALSSGTLRPGTRVGLLAIDLPRRRRLRINGVVHEEESLPPHVSLLRVAEAFPNCPKYINGHEVTVAADAPSGEEPPSCNADTADVWVNPGSCESDASGLGITTDDAVRADTRAIIEAADTMFVATRHANGVDVSHKGGPPGFVEVSASGRELEYPDYRGNNMFCTLGNIHLDPTVAFAIVSWKQRRVVHVAGTAKLRLNPPPAARDATGGDTGRAVTVAVRTVRVETLPDAVRTKFHGLHPLVERMT